MPLYEIALAAQLTADQKFMLANAITDIHVTAFQAPRWYVNVIFSDASLQTAFVGGKPRFSNRITARVRNGKSRSREAFNQLCEEINSAWSRIVHPDSGPDELPPRDLELAAIFIVGELLAGLKVGLPVPEAGHEIEWAKEHLHTFQKRAELGDEDFVNYLEELRRKPDFNDGIQPLA